MFGFRGFGRRGWLRPWVLSMIAKSPKNGVEIMDEVERMSWGSWRPSPGSVYPLLEGLASDGLVRKRDDGRYEITEKGKQESEFSFGMGPFRSGPRGVDQMLGEINGYLSYFEDLARTDKSKLVAYEKTIRDLSERLSKLSTQQ
jgi:DNA-binding PadR family transcriptional regulator